MTQAEQVVAEARRWIGTPYLHQAATFGAGADCLGLLRGAWTLPSGAKLEGLVGQSWRLQRDTAFPAATGLSDTASDIVSKVSFAPSRWLDITSRQRFDRRSFQPRFADALVSVGPERLRLSGGYIYTTTNPFLMFDSPAGLAARTKPRNEATASMAARVDDFWRVSAFARRDVQSGKGVSDGLRLTYEDECFVFDTSLSRRHTAINGETGGTLLLFQITFKTVGQFGFQGL